jgi:sporulation protein YlmC with PRC-barrel domain
MHLAILEDHLYKPNMTAAVTALLIAAAPFAYAATGPASHTIQPDQIRASKMIGSSVYSSQNADIGTVQDVIVDRNGRVASVVVDVGTFLGMGGKDVAVRFSAIKSDNNRLTLDMTKGQLQAAQSYHLENSDTGAGSSASPVHGGQLGADAGSSTAPRQ